MTESEKQEIVNRVLSALSTNSSTIDQMMEVYECVDDDYFETNKGNKVSFGVIRKPFERRFSELSRKIDVFRNVCSRFESLNNESELPENPSEVDKTIGYIINKELYLYVGTGGNVLNGKYINVGAIVGPQGEVGPDGPQGLVGPVGPKGKQGNSGVSGSTDNIVVVNDLNGGESTPEQIKVLSAEQGKVLKGKFDEIGKRINELNISNLYPTNGEGGSNKYTLAGAIAQVPTQYRNIQGLKITFVNNETDKPECWVYNGGTFTTTTNWVLSNDSEKIKDLENECLGEIKTLKTLIKPLTGNVTEKIYSKDSNMIQGYWNQNIFQGTNSAWKSSSSTVNISTENLIGFYVIGNYTDEDKIQFYGLDKQFTHLVLLKDIVSQSLQDYLRDTDKYFNISIKTPYDVVITALYSDNYIDVSKFSENIESLNLQIEKIEENIGQHTLSIEELTIIIDVIRSIIGNIEIIKYTKDDNTVQGYWNQNIFSQSNPSWKSSSSIVELSTDNLINFTFEGEETIEDKIDFYNDNKQWTHSELVQNIKEKKLSEYIKDTDKYYNVGIRQPFNLTVNAVFYNTCGIFDLNKINEAFKKAENAETKSNEAITKSNTLSEGIIPKYYLKTVLVNGKMLKTEHTHPIRTV